MYNSFGDTSLKISLNAGSLLFVDSSVILYARGTCNAIVVVADKYNHETNTEYVRDTADVTFNYFRMHFIQKKRSII